MNVKIEKLIYGGEGLGHQDGHTVFVPFVLPDEVVTIRTVEKKKKFVRGRIQEILTSSSQRVAPPCRHFSSCGGCNYQHIPYQAQLDYKASILRETLSRIGHVPWDGPIITHASPPLGYRNRAQWKIRPVGDRTSIGYFQAGTTALCAAEECPILSPRLQEVLAALRGLVGSRSLPPSLREIEAFADAADEKVLLNASVAGFAGKSPAAIAEQLRNAIPGIESVLLHDASQDRFELFGPGYITYKAAGSSYRVGHLSFFQANRYLVDEFARLAVGEATGTLALDLFAGVGLFTIPLAQKFSQVVAIESNSAAVRDLESNIAAAGVVVRAVSSPVEKSLASWKERPDFVILDPPRAGIEKSAAEKLAALAAPTIHYVSCDPSTLARDLGVLLAGGYAIEELHLFDLFPQSFHIESLVRLKALK